MAEQVGPRPYHRKVSRTFWFLQHPRYVRYMVRELTCLFVGGYTLLLLFGLFRLSQGRSAYEDFLVALQTPTSILLHVVALAFAVYHSVTWFNLTPRAMPIQIGEKFLPGVVIAGIHYGAWLMLSVAVLAFAGVF